MKKITSLVILSIALALSCSKTDTTPITATAESLANKTTTDINKHNFNNPINGNWEIGPFKIRCRNSLDTTIYANTVGDFMYFSPDDTVYYTFNSTNATGLSTYSILNDSVFILGDTMQIIFYDGTRLTTHCFSGGGLNEQWMTYIKKPD